MTMLLNLKLLRKAKK